MNKDAWANRKKTLANNAQSINHIFTIDLLFWYNSPKIIVKNSCTFFISYFVSVHIFRDVRSISCTFTVRTKPAIDTRLCMPNSPICMWAMDLLFTVVALDGNRYIHISIRNTCLKGKVPVCPVAVGRAEKKFILPDFAIISDNWRNSALLIRIYRYVL